MAPKTATPVAVPIWRKVEIAREAMAAAGGCTVAAAAEARRGLTSSRPTPATISPGTSSDKVPAADNRLMSHRPTATSTSPLQMRSLTGKYLSKNPVRGRNGKVTIVRRSRWVPMVSSEYPWSNAM